MEICIGTVLTKIFRERGLTLKDVAAATGVPASTLAEWKTNRAPKNPIQVQKVASYLKVSLHFLLFGKEDLQEPFAKIIHADLFQGTFEITVRKVKI